ncbi:hypothetical protein BLNAU_2237 [Blattamonas nauphoetae]|uniref:Protein kinase domain-containing protein n=1 Tax=Blattamonas nauphoetae TaxID=2049346 RepID=A0ABQ9YGB7_9EUKA|nr:hypothetical protein BLNAU_2237 [Blattamonas nauphoetae]
MFFPLLHVITLLDLSRASASFLRPLANSEEFYVVDGSTGTCAELYPCGTIQDAIDATTTETSTIYIDQGSFDAKITVKQQISLTLIGQMSDGKIVTSLAPMTENDYIVTMTEEGTIQLSTVRVEGLNTVEVSLFVISTGTVIIQHFVAEDITGCEKPLFILSGDATLHMSQSTFENVQGKEAISSTSIGKLTFLDTKSIGSTLLHHKHESVFENFITFETGTLTMEILQLIQDPTELITADVVYTLFQEDTPSMVPLQQPSNSDASMVSLTDDLENTFTGCIIYLDDTTSFPVFASEPTCTLSLTKCYITSTTDTISRPLIQGSFSLTMNSVVFSSISTSASSLISLTDAASFTLMGSPMAKVPTFSNLVSTGDGIIHLDNVVRVMIMSCIFDHCSSKNGGAMFVKQRDDDGNTAEDENWDISIFCTHCTADECGGGLYLSIWRPLRLGGCAFHDCSAKEGGAFFVEMAGTAKLIDGAMSINIFTMQPELRYKYNTASVRGGSLCVIGTSSHELPLELLAGGFTGNFVGGDLNKFGSDVFINLAVASPQILVDFANEFHKGLRSTSDHSTDTDQYPQVYIETPSGEPIRFSRHPPCHLYTMQSVWNGCFMNTGACTCARLEMYLNLIQTKDQYGRSVVNEIKVSSEIASFQVIIITKQSVKLIRGNLEPTDPDGEQYDGSQSIVIDTPSAQQNQLLFSLMADGTLELNNLSILMDEDLTLCTVCDNTARFIISASTLIFTGNIIQFTPLACYFGSLEILNTCLKSEVQTTPIPCTCSLVDVIAALPLSNFNSESLELDTVTAITINSSTFEDFRNGKPVIAISDASYMEIHNPTFTNCMDKDDPSKKAQKLEITGPKLYETIDPDLWSINFDTNDEYEESYFWTTDPSASYDFLKDVTLKIYLEPYKNSTIYTKTEGINAIFCGNGTIPCPTIEGSIDHLLSGSPSQLIVLGASSLNKQVTFTLSNAEIKSDGEQSTITVAKDGGIGHRIDGTASSSLEIKNILFQLPIDLSAPSLISSSSGSITLTSCSFSASSIGFKLLETTGGKTTIASTSLSSLTFSTTPFIFSAFTSLSFSHFNTSACKVSQLISATSSVSSATVSFAECYLSGSSSSNEEADDALCAWQTGLISLTSCTTVVQSCRFAHLSEGALFVSGGSITLRETAFVSNGMGTTKYPSMRQNVVCQGNGEIETEALTFVSGEDLTSSWISASACTFVGDGPKLPMFVPTLKVDNCSSKKVSTTRSYSIHIEGTLFIPCNLKLEVFEAEKKGSTITEFESLFFDIPSNIPTSSSETELDLNIPTASLTLNAGREWHCRLQYGPNSTTASFVIKVGKLSQGGLATVAWLVPLIVVLVAVAIVVVVIILLLRRRKQKKNQSEQEMTPETEDKIEVEVENSHSMQMVKASTNTTKDSVPLTTFGNQQPNPSTITQMTDVLKCGDVCEIVATKKMDTLYERLHKTDQKDINKLHICQMVSKGMASLVSTFPTADIMTRLNPHWILIDTAGHVHLRLQENTQTGDVSAQTGSQNFSQPSIGPARQTNTHEGVRWESPEVVDKKKDFDMEKAAVFSLGLVLWEIETGLVPFGEVDAATAQRQLASGISPNLGLIKDETLRDLIESCLDLNPMDRPTLTTISLHFNPSLKMEEQDKNAPLDQLSNTNQPITGSP